MIVRSLFSPDALVAVFSLLIGFMSFAGGISPFPLGLISSLAVSSGIFLLWLLAKASLRGSETVLKLFFSVVALFAFLITTTSWFYFDYFQSLFTYRILSLGGDLFAGWQTVRFDAHATALLLLSAVTLITLLVVCRARRIGRTSALWSVPVLAVFAGSVFVSERSLSHYRDRGEQWLVPANVHPLHAFFLSNQSDSGVSDAERSAFSEFTKQRERPQQQTLSGTAPQPYNVIIILLESVRADLTGHYSKNEKNLSPHLDALAGQGAMSGMHYSNTTHTVSAEINLWCGVFDRAGEQKLAYSPDVSLNVECLPETLKATGYKSYYFHGNRGNFYNRDKLLPKLGMQNLYFYEDEAQPVLPATKIGWGADDVSLFKTLLQVLLDRHTDGSPFFAHLTTLSNHYPFDWDVADSEFSPPIVKHQEPLTLFQHYQNMVAYTDYALGKFWQEFKQSPLFDNTIVVVTSDHGIWQFEDPDIPLLEKNERFFRAPLFVYHPLLEDDWTIQGPSSHIDVPVTLSHMLGIDAGPKMIGRNLLLPPAPGATVLMGKANDIVFRQDDHVCYYSVEACSGNQQNCKFAPGELMWTDAPKDRYVCHRVTGDILNKYDLAQSNQNAIDNFNQARLMRRYLQKSIIN